MIFACICLGSSCQILGHILDRLRSPSALDVKLLFHFDKNDKKNSMIHSFIQSFIYSVTHSSVHFVSRVPVRSDGCLSPKPARFSSPSKSSPSSSSSHSPPSPSTSELPAPLSRHTHGQSLRSSAQGTPGDLLFLCNEMYGKLYSISSF